MSVQRVFSFGASTEELAESIADKVSNLVVGNAIYADTQCGLLIRNEVDGVEEWVAEAVEAGTGFMWRKGYLILLPLSFLILQKIVGCQHEILAQLFPFKKSMDDAILQANSLPFAFQASVF